MPVPGQDHRLSGALANSLVTERITASCPIVLYSGLKCVSLVADMLMDISSKARLGVKVVLACAGARYKKPSDF